MKIYIFELKYTFPTKITEIMHNLNKNKMQLLQNIEQL